MLLQAEARVDRGPGRGLQVRCARPDLSLRSPRRSVRLVLQPENSLGLAGPVRVRQCSSADFPLCRHLPAGRWASASGASTFRARWGFAITSFVWWIGIGHAGTLISAILLLMHQKWRTSINRIAEAMTIFAVMCAGMFPLLHLGRPWFFYWLLPYPNTMGLWPQFRSALVWDVFAVSTYFTVSLLFWYMGMVPDLATLRDRATSQVRPGHLRHPGAGLAQFRPALAPLRNGLSAARRAGDAAGGLGPFGRQLRFRHLERAGLARDGLPALLRRRGDFFRLCDGLVALYPDPPLLRLAAVHHRRPSGGDGQAGAGDLLGHLLRLSQRAIHVLVRRRSSGAVTSI